MLKIKDRYICNKCSNVSEGIEEHYWHMKLHTLDLENAVLDKAYLVGQAQLRKDIEEDL